jgi:Protein of unknown function (DUF2690)
MTKRRFAVLLGMVSALILGLGVMFPSSASAATCNGNSCTGKNPETYGCGDDAETIRSATDNGYSHVELRYSPYCNAAWAKGFPEVNAGPYTMSIDRKTNSTGHVSHYSAVAQQTSAYTVMFAVNSTHQYRACGDDGSSSLHCTTWW